VQARSRAASNRPPPILSALVVVSSILAPAFGAFITATILPSAIAEIGGLAIYAWASTAYAVGSILGSAASSVVALKVGTRRGVFLAVAVFVAGAAICATAPSMSAVVVGRGVQGLGGGVLIASAHSLVRELFPQTLWQRMLTAISCAWAIPALGGPVVGGVLAGLGLWRAAFWVMAPIALVAGAFTWSILPRSESHDTRATRVPFGRLALICLSVLCVGSIANTRRPPRAPRSSPARSRPWRSCFVSTAGRQRVCSPPACCRSRPGSARRSTWSSCSGCRRHPAACTFPCSCRCCTT
jgi:MFS family permease